MCTKMHLTYSPVQEPIASRLDNLFGIKNCLIEVNPGRVLMPPKYSEIGDRILNMKVREDDIWLASLPRTGSTWTQEMVWLLANDLDYEGAKVIQHLRTPILELSAILAHGHESFMESYGDSVEFVEKLQSPRFIKSHLPISLLPQEFLQVKPKLVYVARNPKDMCVSYYYYCKLIHNLQSSLEDFCELVLTDSAPIGSVFSHILGYWALRNEPNVLFIKYEEMKRDQLGHIRKTAKFLGKEYTEEQMQHLADYLSFNSFKKNPAVNLEPILEQSQGKDFMKKVGIDFIRKGVVGDYKNHMSEDLSRRFDEWIESNLKGTGLSFD